MFAGKGMLSKPSGRTLRAAPSCRTRKPFRAGFPNTRRLYYLGIQTDISADFHPPYLGHKVLVEGVVSNEPRICGGIVLKPVVVSPLPEPDSTCNTILPAVDKYTVPFAPRPPGPSGGTLAFQAPPSLLRHNAIRAERVFALLRLRHAGNRQARRQLSQIVDYAEKIEAKRVIVSSSSRSDLLSDGSLMTEQPIRAGPGRRDRRVAETRRPAESGDPSRALQRVRRTEMALTIGSPAGPQSASNLERPRVPNNGAK